MYVQFLNNQTTGILKQAFQSTVPDKNIILPPALQERVNFQLSGQATGIELRMLPPYISYNNTPRIWPFPGRARVYCLTMVVSDVENQLVGAIDLNGFPDICSKEYLPINKTIYYWQSDNNTSKGPSQVHLMCALLKSKEALRETGDVLHSVREDSEYKDVIDKLSSIVADTASFSVVSNMSLQLASIIGRYLGNIHDCPIGTMISSFTRLHGDWDRVGVNPLLVRTRNVEFNFELIIRDASRSPEVFSAGAVLAPPQPGLVPL